MKKNTLKKVFSALSLTAVAASAVSLSAFAAPSDYTAVEIANSAVKPKITTTKLVVDKDQAGQDVNVTLDVAGAEGKYCNTGIRIYYSDRLTLKIKGNGKAAVADGPAIADLGTKTNKVDDSCTREGFDSWFMTTGGEGDYGVDGTMWTLTFTIPADAKEGEVFPLDILYQSVGETKDAFFDYSRSDAGMLMEAYAFTQGIYSNENPTFAASAEDIAKCAALADLDPTYDGYIAIAGAPATTTTTTVATTTTTVATTTTTKAPDTTTKAADTTTKAPGTTTKVAGTTTKKAAGTTTKKGGTTTKPATTTGKKDSSPKTGVAGVGVAAAGLAVAIGTAFVLRKKED